MLWVLIRSTSAKTLHKNIFISLLIVGGSQVKNLLPFGANSIKSSFPVSELLGRQLSVCKSSPWQNGCKIFRVYSFLLEAPFFCDVISFHLVLTLFCLLLIYIVIVRIFLDGNLFR